MAVWPFEAELGMSVPGGARTRLHNNSGPPRIDRDLSLRRQTKGSAI